MPEELTNEEKIQAVSQAVSECALLLAQYEAGKLKLAGGQGEVDIPAAKVTALKQKFAAVRTAGIAIWEGMTA